MKHFLSVLVMAIILITPLASQAQETYRTCDTDKYFVEELKSNPAYRISREQLEDFTRDFVQNMPQSAQKSTGAIQYTIPVVFHVMHNYGPENISKAQVLNAVDHLNKSFQNLWSDTTSVNPPFKPIIADCEIQFKLAQKDPNGNCHDGITRTVTSLTYDAGNNVKTLIKWPYSKYLNVWVVQNIASGAAGYAYYPGANNSNDGIVIRSDYVGVGSNYAIRSLTHEVGHWLNLPHTWGGTNDPGLAQNCSNDDFVQDTPNTLGVANFSCSYSQVTCSTLDNVENYMDYAGCSYMFTNGQKARMHAAMNNSAGSRNNLNTIGNLQATGTDPNHVMVDCVPIPDFDKRIRYVCAGSSITFQDLSWKGDPSTWQWDVPGGSPSTSGSKNPTIQYNTPGVYNVTLTVSNSAGSATITSSSMVVVSPAGGGSAVPFTEDFENVSIPNSYNWFVENEAGNTWQITSTASQSGTQSARIINHSGNNTGTYDALITPGYDFTNITNGLMTFDLAFAARSTSSTDQLKVYASSDCGQNWNIRYTKTGMTLSTAGLIIPSFIPNGPNQWREESVPVSGVKYNNKPSVKFKFEYTQNSGNNIYIDDINITGTSTVGIEDVEFLATLNIYPNPSNGQTTTSFSLSESNNVKVELVDIAGRLVQVVSEGYLPQGTHEYQITSDIPSGSYFVRYTVGDNTITRKYIRL